jgi:DDE domain
VREIRFDPYQLVAVSQRLQRTGLRMVEFAQSVPNLTEASTNLYEIVKGRNLKLYPDADMRLSMSRAVALETSRGWRIADHRAIKRRGKAKQSFREFHAARRTIAGYEAMHMIRKGQARWVSNDDVRQQNRFIDQTVRSGGLRPRRPVPLGTSSVTVFKVATLPASELVAMPRRSANTEFEPR